MTAQITEREVLELLHDIDSGEMPLKDEQGGAFDEIRTWETGPNYRIGGGWVISVWSENGEWGGITSVLAPDMRGILVNGRRPKLAKYKPSAKALRTIWRW